MAKLRGEMRWGIRQKTYFLFGTLVQEDATVEGFLGLGLGGLRGRMVMFLASKI